MRTLRDTQDELIATIHLLKLRLVAKYGPKIVEKWSPRTRDVQ